MRKHRKLFRALPEAVNEWLRAEGAELRAVVVPPFPCAEVLLDEEDLALIRGAVLGVERQFSHRIAPMFTLSNDGPWVWALSTDATTRIASYSTKEADEAAGAFPEYAESDLPPQTRSSSWGDSTHWRTTMRALHAFCGDAIRNGEGVFLYRPVVRVA